MKRLLFLFVLLTTGTCFSQSMLRVQHLNVDDGLSQSSVYSIFQDSYGFIWFATGDGLNRYDGKEFITYKSRLADSLPDHLKDRNINSQVIEDNLHNLWFAADEGVYCMDRRKRQFTVHINKYETAYAALIAGVDSNSVWVAVPGKGIYNIKVRSNERRLYPFSQPMRESGHSIALIGNCFNTPGGLWIADTKGLLWFDKQTLRDSRVLNHDGINWVHRQKNGLLLLATTNGLILYDPVKKTEQFIPVKVPGKESVMWKCIVEDTVSGFAYASEIFGGAICKLDLRSLNFEILSFQGNNINRLFIDRSQNLWVGTDGGGVYKVDIKPPNFYSYAPGRTSNTGFMVKCLYRDSWGAMWIGVFDKGLFGYDPATKKETAILVPSLEEGLFISNIMRDSAGDIVVTMNNKLVWFDELTRTIKREISLPFYAWLSNANPTIYALTEWKKGCYLVGTNFGLYTVRTSSGKVITARDRPLSLDSLLGGWTYNLYKAANGDLYVGKRNGFAKFSITNDSLPTIYKSGLHSLPVRHFYKSDHTPVLWLATEQGLMAYNESSDKYTVFDESSGIANSFIYAILPENDSTLWISTNNGLSRIVVKYGDCRDIKIRSVNYSAKDGLQSNEFNTGAYFKCNDGTLMFGGIAGVNWFRPTEIVSNPYKAVPAITGIYIDDTLRATDTVMFMDKIDLPYNRNTVSFSIRALEFTLPEQNSYAYMLKGLDKDWVNTSNDIVRYSNLAPGTYTFLLKARNNETLWNDEPLQMIINIHPPWWQTWWFRALVLLTITSGIILAARYYIHQKVLVKTRELEQQHALNLERLRISKDVHDDIGSGLSKISLLSEIANRKIKDNHLPGKDITNISAIAKELVDNMRDLIWVLNPENTTLDNLLSRMREYCSDYLDGVGINAVMNFPDSVPAMNISREVQRNIFSTVKEAVNNVVKHAHANEITIKVTMANNMLSVRISDNGEGFVANERNSRGNGLRNMRQRIESVGGEYVISSQKQQGTIVNISIPLDRLNKESA